MGIKHILGAVVVFADFLASDGC